MTPSPKISIVTPSYNHAAFLEETLQSVLQQGYPSLEYVVIDGGSSDGSVDIIRRHQAGLHYWVSERDSGHADALNKGFARTSGEIMAWINSDDKYLPWTFRVVAEIFRQFPQVEWIGGFDAFWNDRGELTTARRHPRNVYDFLMGNYGWIQQESTFWRRSLWERAGGYISRDYKLMVDGELWCRFFAHADLYSVDCILGGFREHADNRSRHNYADCLTEMEQAIEVLRQRCDPGTLATCRRLELVRKALPFLSLPPLSYLSRELPLFRRVAYRNIYYGEGGWRERRLPFSLIKDVVPAIAVVPRG